MLHIFLLSIVCTWRIKDRGSVSLGSVFARLPLSAIICLFRYTNTISILWEVRRVVCCFCSSGSVERAHSLDRCLCYRARLSSFGKWSNLSVLHSLCRLLEVVDWTVLLLLRCILLLYLCARKPSLHSVSRTKDSASLLVEFLSTIWSDCTVVAWKCVNVNLLFIR